MEDCERFYMDEKHEALPAFCLERWGRTLNKKELSRLVEAFSNTFSFYNLLIRFQIANDRREEYALWVIYGITNHTNCELRIPREDFLEMRNFVRGFEKGIRAFRIKGR